MDTLDIWLSLNAISLPHPDAKCHILKPYWLLLLLSWKWVKTVYITRLAAGGPSHLPYDLIS